MGCMDAAADLRSDTELQAVLDVSISDEPGVAGMSSDLKYRNRDTCA